MSEYKSTKAQKYKLILQILNSIDPESLPIEFPTNIPFEALTEFIQEQIDQLKCSVDKNRIRGQAQSALKRKIIREDVLSVLTHEPQTATEIARALGLSFQAVKYALVLLTNEGITIREEEIVDNGRHIRPYYRLAK